jgi:hypothetical protein
LTLETPSLRQLDLSNCSALATESLVDALQSGGRNLRNLWLDSTQVRTDAVLAVARFCPLLEQLNIADATNITLAALRNLIATHRTLQRIFVQPDVGRPLSEYTEQLGKPIFISLVARAKSTAIAESPL